MFKGLNVKLPQEITLDSIRFQIHYTLRKGMKRLVLRLEKASEIRLSARHFRAAEVTAFIQEHRHWIIKEHQRLEQRFSVGSSLYLMGIAYAIEHHDAQISLDGRKVRLNPAMASGQIDRLYKQHAKEHIPLRLTFWQNVMGLEASKMSFRKTKRRWGSCNSLKEISFNPYVMQLDSDMIDYVIVHELCHLQHLNHSKAFYTMIEEFLPDYRSIEYRIKQLHQKILGYH
jgi:predicted metal-dependent hydrolase